MNFDNVPAGLIDLLSHVDLYKNVRWQLYGEDDKRQPTDRLTEAQAAGSRIREQVTTDLTGAELIDPDAEQHYLLLDLDVPAWLVPSSTPGHSHLYVETPIVWRDLVVLLQALAACGVIETGYASASIDRKATTLRLPWVAKTTEYERGLQAARDEVAKMWTSGDWEGQVSLGFMSVLGEALDRRTEDRLDPTAPTTCIHDKPGCNCLTQTAPAEQDPLPPAPDLDLAHDLGQDGCMPITPASEHDKVCAAKRRPCTDPKQHDWHDWLEDVETGNPDDPYRSEVRHCSGQGLPVRPSPWCTYTGPHDGHSDDKGNICTGRWVR